MNCSDVGRNEPRNTNQRRAGISTTATERHSVGVVTHDEEEADLVTPTRANGRRTQEIRIELEKWVLSELGAPGAVVVSGDALEAGVAMKRFAGWSIPNGLPARVRDHDKLNLDRVFANPRDLGYHRCKPAQHKTGNHLMREAVGMHQTLGDAARNPGKPLQGMVFVGCHLSSLPSEPTNLIKEKITRIWTADYRQQHGL